jgi:putative membrane protein
MSRAWLDDRAERALAAAAAQIEATSAVEVAIAVRRSARSWPHVPVIAGGLAAWATLAFMLFSDPVFPLIAFLFDPLIAGIVTGGAVTFGSWPIRLLTSASARRAAATRAARATFVDRGVHRTRARSGVLVYCALAERTAVVIADSGVERAVPQSALDAWQDQIGDAIGRGGVATADAVAAMAHAFAAALPRAADDVNELQDAIEHDIDRRPRT